MHRDLVKQTRLNLSLSESMLQIQLNPREPRQLQPKLLQLKQHQQQPLIHQIQLQALLHLSRLMERIDTLFRCLTRPFMTLARFAINWWAEIHSSLDPQCHSCHLKETLWFLWAHTWPILLSICRDWSQSCKELVTSCKERVFYARRQPAIKPQKWSFSLDKPLSTLQRHLAL